MKIFQKKKTEEEKPREFDVNEFEIPQIPKDIFKFRNTKKELFNPTPFVSPVFGDNVKDEVVVPDTHGLGGDIKKSYDAFRSDEDKLISKEEAIKEYGHEYGEFDSVIMNAEKRQEIFGTNYQKKEAPVEQNPIQEEEKEVTYSFIKDKEEILSELESTQEDNEPVKEAIEEEKPIKKDSIEEPMKDFSFQFDSNPQDTYEESKDEVFYEEEMDQAELIEEEHEDSFIPPVKEKKIETKSFISEEKEETIPNEEPKREEEYEFYQYPPYSVFKKGLDDFSQKEEWIDDQIQIINNTLQQFSVDGTVVNYTKGPTLTRYEIRLEAGVNVRKVTSLEDNLKMNLAAKSLTIQAPIPGKPNVGIEVGNPKRENVCFGNVIDNEEFKNNPKPLTFAVGKDIEGKNIFLNIAKTPHMLVAGQTGSGKSVCVNTMLVSLLMRNKPNEMKLMLIDPKFVELAVYNELPHLVTPVINDPKEAAKGLEWACQEMDRRYQIFSETRTKEIEGYNEKIKLTRPKGYSTIPYIVIVIDELADLMQTAGKEVEDSIQRLTQKSRACGIHLIVATQRPTTEVVKGTIKANIPTRLAFKVASHVDSSTILDQTGAEELLGQGDVLIRYSDVISRCQCAYIPDSEIEAVTDFIRNQYPPHYMFTHDKLKVTVNSKKYDDWDVIKEVAVFVVANHTASINRITKQFGMGFNRCQEIINTLESLSIVGPNVGSKAREVLVDDAQLKEILESQEN